MEAILHLTGFLATKEPLNCWINFYSQPLKSTFLKVPGPPFAILLLMRSWKVTKYVIHSRVQTVPHLKSGCSERLPWKPKLITLPWWKNTLLLHNEAFFTTLILVSRYTSSNYIKDTAMLSIFIYPLLRPTVTQTPFHFGFHYPSHSFPSTLISLFPPDVFHQLSCWSCTDLGSSCPKINIKTFWTTGDDEDTPGLSSLEEAGPINHLDNDM